MVSIDYKLEHLAPLKFGKDLADPPPRLALAKKIFMNVHLSFRLINILEMPTGNYGRLTRDHCAKH